MKILVQKFGGTSLASKELRSRVCDIVADAKSAGYAPVVVVSAMGRENAAYATDTLINLVKEVNPEPLPRSSTSCCPAVKPYVAFCWPTK